MDLMVQISPSPIEGLGVFAKVNIPKGTLISYFTGIEMSHKEFKEKYGKDKRYVYQRPPWLPLIVAKDNRNLITFINCANYGNAPKLANCFLKSRWLISQQDIKKNEELLLDYPKGYFNPPKPLG